MTGMDLETAARAGIATLTIVLNNGIMAAERDVLVVSDEKYGAMTVSGNYTRVAVGLGVAAARVETPDALERGIAVTEAGAPFLIECMVKGGRASRAIEADLRPMFHVKHWAGGRLRRRARTAGQTPEVRLSRRGVPAQADPPCPRGSDGQGRSRHHGRRDRRAGQAPHQGHGGCGDRHGPRDRGAALEAPALRRADRR